VDLLLPYASQVHRNSVTPASRRQTNVRFEKESVGRTVCLIFAEKGVLMASDAPGHEALVTYEGLVLD
jgi:hypothetical protein